MKSKDLQKAVKNKYEKVMDQQKSAMILARWFQNEQLICGYK